MTANGWLQVAFYFGVLTALSIPLGWYIVAAMDGRAPLLARLFGPLERLTYRLGRVDPGREMDWLRYALAFLLFSGVSTLALYALQRFQGFLPLNPGDFSAASPHLSFNTAVSFATNTNWQSYGGETTYGYLVPMLGLTVQNFVSAAAGLAVLTALVRGIVRRQARSIGNFWTDLVRGTLYVLLPLSLVLAVALVSQGVVQTLGGYAQVELLQPAKDAEGNEVTAQTLPLGPAASQVAIKQLGTNGGGHFNVNSAHPLENPTPLSNFLELLSILLIPGALCFSYGRWVGDVRQGVALYVAMALILAAFLGLALWAEPGNMEGKEVRFGVVNSALWATATTAASNGSVNSMHDSYNPLGGLAPMVLMGIGEVAFGGVGSGLYGMLAFVFIAVFIAGLMVGRTPEYLGKKIESFEMRMAAVVILVPPLVVLVGTALAVALPEARTSISNPGPHGFSQVLYNFTSAGNNNGSAFAGMNANTPFYNTGLALAMLFARFFTAVPILAIAGGLARKKYVPPSSGTLPTHTPLFVTLLIGVVMIVGALTFFPAYALGPIVEHLQLAAAVR